jgi:hypothetical protein
MTPFDIFLSGFFTCGVFMAAVGVANTWQNARLTKAKQLETLRKENEDLRVQAQKPHFVNVGFTEQQLTTFIDLITARISAGLNAANKFVN